MTLQQIITEMERADDIQYPQQDCSILIDGVWVDVSDEEMVLTFDEVTK